MRGLGARVAAMSFEQIEVSIDGAVATVVLSRADALNAITPTMLVS